MFIIQMIELAEGHSFLARSILRILIEKKDIKPHIK